MARQTGRGNPAKQIISRQHRKLELANHNQKQSVARVKYLTSLRDANSRHSPRSESLRHLSSAGQPLSRRRTTLDTYDGYSKRLKKAYTAKLKKLPDFSTLGYIYSDWAKFGFDGKQLTVTTYI